MLFPEKEQGDGGEDQQHGGEEGEASCGGAQ